jgi:hypothetical protein
MDELEIPGFSGAGRARDGDAVGSGSAPGLRGNEVHFVAVGDGTLIVDEDEPDGSVAPLAEAIEQSLKPPYRAVGARQEGDLWSVGAAAVRVVEFPASFAGDSIELSNFGGTRQLLVDGEPSEADVAVFEQLAAGEGADYAVTAERLTETTWVVDVTPL